MLLLLIAAAAAAAQWVDGVCAKAGRPGTPPYVHCRPQQLVAGPYQLRSGLHRPQIDCSWPCYIWRTDSGHTPGGVTDPLAADNDDEERLRLPAAAAAAAGRAADDACSTS